MLAFLAVLGPIVLVVYLASHSTKKHRKEVQVATREVAETAQRQFVSTFGQEDTGLHATLSKPVHQRRT